MESEGNSNTTEVAKVRTATFTGDMDKDWGRFVGYFGQIDQGLRHRLACLLGFNGLWLIGVAQVSYVNSPELFSAKVLIYLVGFLASLALYWAQYRAVAHRRALVRDWESRYPDPYPSPGGVEWASVGSVSADPHVLIPFTLAVFWLIAGAWRFSTARNWLSGRYIEMLSCGVAGILVIVVVLTFAPVFVNFRAEMDPERKPPRKW